MDEIRTGADIYCADEKVGHVSRLIADAVSSHITDLVVDRGLLHAAKVIPLDQADGFSDEKFSDPAGDWSAPPGYSRDDFMLNVVTAFGAGAGYGAMGGRPDTFPPSPTDPRPDLIQPDVEAGSPVRATDGSKVGEVAEIDIDPSDGHLIRLTLKRGLLGREHVQVPLEWIEQISNEGVILKTSAAEVDALKPAD